METLLEIPLSLEHLSFSVQDRFASITGVFYASRILFDLRVETFFFLGRAIVDSAGLLDILCRTVEDRGEKEFVR